MLITLKSQKTNDTCNVTDAEGGLSPRDFGQLGGKEDFSSLHYTV